MFAKSPVDIELWLFGGFAVALVLWFALSAFVIIDRLWHDRRTRVLNEVMRALADPSAPSHTQLRRSPHTDQLFARLSRRAVYHMAADATLPVWINEISGAYALDQWGLARMVRDASTHRWRRKWRRISALFALEQIRAAAGEGGIHDLLERAVFDRDPDVAGAAVVILHRLQDRRAAEILISALREQSYAPSRIATQLEQFAIPIGDLLRPLLADPRPHARYWAVSLLSHSPDAASLAPEIAALANDPHPPVRKAVLETLGRIGDSSAASVAVHGLGDSVAFVRSTAVRSLARLAKSGKREDETAEHPESRRAAAARIAPFLADVAWDVRLAAKEALAALGPGVWREVASQLDSPDRFARNGSAEVLQNLGLLDRVIDDIGHGVEPSTELVGVLERAFQEGGPGLFDAAAARSNHELFPSVETLLTRLRFVGVRMSA